MTTQFTTDEFFAWLGQWSRLSDWQLKTTLAIASHVSETAKEDEQLREAYLDEVKTYSATIESKREGRPHYTDKQHQVLRDVAAYWLALTEEQKQSKLHNLAGSFGRTESQIKRMIHKYRTGK